MPDARCAAGRWPLAEGALISVFILGLFYYWYALADRYAVFLYGHVASPGDPGAQPFDEMTASRYWMCGLVACGAVLILYAAANWVQAQWAHRRGKRMERKKVTIHDLQAKKEKGEPFTMVTAYDICGFGNNRGDVTILL